MNIMNKVTLKGLMKNKTRTIVTIIGVILSTSMLTAVTTFISSLQQYILDFTIADKGNWHGVFQEIDVDDYRSLKENDAFGKVALTHLEGYSMLEGTNNKYKPYLRVLEADDTAFDTLPIKLTSGRLPQNNTEVLVSEHIDTNGGVKYSLGDKLTLNMGDRILDDGTIVTNINSYIMGENNEIIETLNIKESKTYTVVGFCKRLDYLFESYSDPGYTLITKMNTDDMNNMSLNAYVKAKSTRKVLSLIKDLADELGIERYDYNSELLRYMGISNNNSFNRVLYSLAAILIALIMVGSISLIYNSFSISLSERVKQFGLLSSTGATALQRSNSVFFESFVIAAIGIPFGLLAGIAGIGTTLYLLKNQLTTIMPTDYTVTLSLSVSWPAIVIAAALALVTILISASIPARRSKRISAMDAIRQTTDIKLTARKVKTSRLTRRLFGIEGDIALKNLKRNRRRYRSTVISLFISVVLFVSASAFSMYLKDSVSNVYDDTEFDFLFSNYNSSDYNSDEDVVEIDREMYKDILALDDIEQGSIVKILYEHTWIAKEYVNNDHYQRMVADSDKTDEDGLDVELIIYSVDHDTFMEYIGEIGLDESRFIGDDKRSVIVVDYQHFYNHIENRYNNTHIIKDKSLDTLSIEYFNDNGEEKRVNVDIAAFAEEVPFGITPYSFNNSLLVIMDERQLDTSLSELRPRWDSEIMYFSAKNPMDTIKKATEIIKAEGIDLNVQNIAEEIQSSRNIITIINVFAYGFITLISLITIANVFNTISTNVNLRRREFAMLKSVGMTNRSFTKMLNYECIFYGLKALLYGLPASIGVTYLIYKGIENGVDMGFYLPGVYILISVCSVFLVVFISMMYSMSKTRRENIIDGIRNENM
jgi:putative ABC transport system permease protein